MKTTINIERSSTPSAEFRYFIFDPSDGDFLYYKSAADRDADSQNIIALYLDDGWDESVEQIVAGEISHTCDKVNVVQRPEKIDENGYDDSGNYWAEEWHYKCEYELLQLTAQGGDA